MSILAPLPAASVQLATERLAGLTTAARTGRLSRRQARLLVRALAVYRDECSDPRVLLLAMNVPAGGER